MEYIEKYYFKKSHSNISDAIERCNVKDNGVMIGSVKCQQCIFCIEHEKPCESTGNLDWIKCSKIDEALKRNHHPLFEKQ